MSREEPLHAFTAAYDSLEHTPIQDDHPFRMKIAWQVVQTLKKARKVYGLAWMRRIGNGPDYYNKLVTLSEEFGSNPDLMVGRLKMYDAYINTAAQFVKEFGRKQ